MLRRPAHRSTRTAARRTTTRCAAARRTTTRCAAARRTTTRCAAARRTACPSLSARRTTTRQTVTAGPANFALATGTVVIVESRARRCRACADKPQHDGRKDKFFRTHDAHRSLERRDRDLHPFIQEGEDLLSRTDAKRIDATHPASRPTRTRDGGTLAPGPQ